MYAPQQPDTWARIYYVEFTVASPLTSNMTLLCDDRVYTVCIGQMRRHKKRTLNGYALHYSKFVCSNNKNMMCCSLLCNLYIMIDVKVIKMYTEVKPQQHPPLRSFLASCGRWLYLYMDEGGSNVIVFDAPTDRLWMSLDEFFFNSLFFASSL